MKWFLVLYYCTNCIGIDPGIQQGWIPTHNRYEISVPDETTCRQIQKLNQSSECWAKSDKQP